MTRAVMKRPRISVIVHVLVSTFKTVLDSSYRVLKV